MKEYDDGLLLRGDGDDRVTTDKDVWRGSESDKEGLEWRCCVVGGLTAVIWTDFIQTIIMLVGAVYLMSASESSQPLHTHTDTHTHTLPTLYETKPHYTPPVFSYTPW